MPKILENHSLKAYNTFGFDVIAKWLCVIHTIEDFLWLKEQEVYQDNEILFLGGGSNVLLQADFNGLVVVNRIIGVSFEEESDKYTIVKAGAGENWHELVLKTIEAKLGGLENLSLIPGTVGAAPMQNIGAYGVEVKDVFFSLEAINLETGAIEQFNKEVCQFGYRESVFKNVLKGKYLIVTVSFRLMKENFHQISVQYGAIKEVLDSKKINSPTIMDVSNAVIEIRQSKLPDPKVIGNSGSFFKNPVVDKGKYEYLKLEYPEMPGYNLGNEEVKLAAGWLIEQAGWKGYTENGVGVHQKQALVLVNIGEGSGLAIAQLATKIQDSVKAKFGIELNPEVNFI